MCSFVTGMVVTIRSYVAANSCILIGTDSCVTGMCSSFVFVMIVVAMVDE